MIFEMDLDFCNNTYGVAPCTASGSAGFECFNCRATCQDPENYDEGTLTLRYSKNEYTGIKDQVVYPALKKVTTTPSRIALAQADNKVGSLGRRAEIQVTLNDFRCGDVLTDPYRATRFYAPEEQGTHFGKQKARSPYFFGRAGRIKTGEVGDDLASMRTRNWIITKMIGPSSNNQVVFTLKDPLVLADADLSQVPVPSRGVLASGIGSGYTGAVTLEPSGIGAEYSASGKVCIGSEVMSFTRAGDVVTITERATDGTTAAAHSAGDTVQQCYVAEGETIDAVASDLLENYAGVEASFIPTGDWLAEVGDWLSGFLLDRVIPKSIPTIRALGELCDLGVFVWWSEIDQEVKLRANRPANIGETFTAINDIGDIIESSAKVEELEDQRLTSVIYYHGLRDATLDTRSAQSYSRATVPVAEDNPYGQERTLEIFQPWLGQNGDNSIALAAASRIFQRYKTRPQRVEFMADIKDQADLELASLVEVTTHLIQDQFGADAALQMQVTEAEEIAPNHRIRVVAQTYEFQGKHSFVGPNSTPDHGSATAQQKADVMFIVDESTMEFADGSPPYVIF